MATFTNKTVTITHNDKTILSRTRNTTTHLWNVDMPTPTTNNKAKATNPIDTTNSAYNINQSNKTADLVAFVHASFFSLALTTLSQALHKNYINHFPGLTVQLLRNHPPQSMATVKGHLDQSRKNQRSTKPNELCMETETETAEGETPETEDNTNNKDFWPASDPHNESTHQCFATCTKDQATGKIFTDQTGRFIIPSSTGNTQMFILYDYDSNSIHAEPIKNRSAPKILRAFKTVTTTLTNTGLRPKLQRMDNECSTLLADHMTKQGIDFQLVPAGQHRRNAAERAIRTFKNHFVAGLCTTDKHFPLHLWDKLIPQAILTLNLMRGSCINPNLSAWAQVHGNYDFNCTPIAPPGVKVLVHEKPSNRTTWAPHANEGWYVGPALQAYRCYRTWITETKQERTADTLTWFPTTAPIPTVSSQDIIERAT